MTHRVRFRSDNRVDCKVIRVCLHILSSFGEKY